MQEWTGMERRGTDWIGRVMQDWSGAEWTGMERIGSDR
jgi:hypothetical protein